MTGDDACPYQGLAAFEAEDAALFFGRARATDGLLDRLGRRLDGHGSILMVSGASGVGKSSLLRAGLLPALAGGRLAVAGSRDWARVLVTPTATPLRMLAGCWSAMYERDAEAVHEQLRADPHRAWSDLVSGAHGPDATDGATDGAADGATDGATDGAADAADGRLVWVVDQFEELFTLVADERERQAFVGALSAMAEGPTRAGVIIGVRADYWDRCAAYPELAEAIQDGQVIVEPMTESDLRLAITGPAAAVDLELEPGLVETVLAELRAGRDATDRYAPAALPLLSQALRSTWDRRERGQLTIRGYEASGRVRDAVQHTADEVFQRLSPEDRTTALKALRRLTVITAGGRVARRRATLPEIHAAVSASSADDRGRVEAMISAFADKRLLTLDEDSVEISHDALLSGWPTLRRWLDPDLTAQAVYDQLIEDATRWDEHRRDAAFLYRGGRLLAVQDTRSRWDRDPDSFPPPGPTAVAFVAASARAAKRAARRRQVVMAGLAVLSVAALMLAVAAVDNARDAGRQRALAVSRQLAAQSEVIGATDPVTSALLAVSAWRIAPTPEARYSMLNAAGRPGRGVLTGHGGAVDALAFSPDGKTMATGSKDGTARLWDTASRRQLGAPIALPPDACHADGVDVAFHPNGKILATSCFGPTVRFWDVATHREVGNLLDGTDFDWVHGIAISPDGKTIATAGQEGTVRLWDMATRRQSGNTIKYPQSTYYKQIDTVAFSRDGKRLAAAGNDKTVRLWDAATHRQIGAAFTGHTLPVNHISFSPDGATLATASVDGTVRLWDLADDDHRQIAVLRSGAIIDSDHAIAFSPDGKRLATAGENDSIQLWDTLSRRRVGLPLTNNGVAAGAVAFSPDGSVLAIAGSDGIVRLADPRVHQQVGAAVPGRNAVALSPDGKTLATPDPTAAAEPALRLWDATTQRPIDPPVKHPDRTESGAKDFVFNVGFRRDGAAFATASLHDGVRLWDTASHRQVGPPVYSPRDQNKVDIVEFSPDANILAVKGSQSIRFWDVAGRRQIGSDIPDRTFTSQTMAFSRDGRTFAIGGSDRRVRLFDVAAQRQLGSALPAGGAVSAVVFSPDGRTLATGDDRTVRLWDVASHRPLGTPLVGHGRAIRSIAFSPDGKALVTGSTDRTARLWDLRTFRQIGLALSGHTDMVVEVAYSSDGSRVATVSEDKTARLWDVALPADPAAAACASAGRSLTRAEWERYIPGEKFRQVCQ